MKGSRKRKCEPIEVTVSLSPDDADAFVRGVFTVTSLEHFNCAEAALKALRGAVRQARERA